MARPSDLSKDAAMGEIKKGRGSQFNFSKMGAAAKAGQGRHSMKDVWDMHDAQVDQERGGSPAPSGPSAGERRRAAQAKLDESNERYAQREKDRIAASERPKSTSDDFDWEGAFKPASPTAASPADRASSPARRSFFGRRRGK